MIEMLGQNVFREQLYCHVRNGNWQDLYHPREREFKNWTLLQIVNHTHLQLGFDSVPVQKFGYRTVQVDLYESV